jgi:hypothetical protein
MAFDPEYLPSPKAFLPTGALVDTEPRRAVDVVRAFNRLRDRAEHIGSWDMDRIPHPVYTFQNTDGGETRTHFQGVQRLAHHPLLVVSGGDRKNAVSHLFLVQCSARSTWGPVGSNLWKGTRPPGHDRLRRIIGLDRDRWHAGGISVLGDIIAVQHECSGNAEVVFLDLSTPASPRWAQPATSISCATPAAGAAALTRTPGGRFLCAVWRDEIKAAGEKTGRVDFFLSAAPVPADQRLTTFEPAWEFLGAWVYPENPAESMPSRPHYQGISFVWDRGTGQLFLIGTRNTKVTAPNDAGEDLADLFGVLPHAAGSRTPALDHVTSIRLRGADQFCNFAGGGGAFVSEAGALALYGAFHFRGDGIFRLSEFWSDLAEGPTWWVDLFERSDFTGHRFSVFGPEEGRIEEYRQRFAQGTAFDDTVVSARFCLPAGTTYRLFRDAGCSDAAGPDACFDLVGTGSVVEIPRLEVMHPAFGRVVRSSAVISP